MATNWPPTGVQASISLSVFVLIVALSFTSDPSVCQANNAGLEANQQPSNWHPSGGRLRANHDIQGHHNQPSRRRSKRAQQQTEQVAYNKRPASADMQQSKRFKSRHSTRSTIIGLPSLSAAALKETLAAEPSSRTSDANNNNNNNTVVSESLDINSNIISIDKTDDMAKFVPARNINSINGTIDLSQYEQSDVDRLYGDALLVYFKNFNEQEGVGINQRLYKQGANVSV